MDDRPLSTGPDAEAAYRDGVVELLAGRTAAAIAALYRSVELDPAFALGHAGLAVARAAPGGSGAAGPDPVAAAGHSARGISRWERQHLAVVRLVLSGDLERAAALGREHLAEFGDDAVVRYAVTRHCADVDDVADYGNPAVGDVVPRANASA